ncbi:MAG TPA: hypothetical protein DDY71_09505 [Spirochaetia bacterium]|nr:hypothetical protein [Spirochaetia bacterium]HBI37867.1 hypothetical protein [Spirochaetia bacterium]
MEAKNVYERLRSDFITEETHDDWSFMTLNEFVCDEFKQQHNGLVYDNSRVIKRVFIVTFPDEALIETIINNNSDILIFSHHPMIWSSLKSGIPFVDIPVRLVSLMKEKRISFFVLHSPLDVYGEYSTSLGFMQALRMKYAGNFFQYKNESIGVIAATEYTTTASLSDYIASRVGHPLKLFSYGDAEITGGKIGIVAGGGNVPEALEALKECGINTYVTGVTKIFEGFKPSADFHEIAKKYSINIIGATHYSTEKWACMNMLDYFRKIGLGCVFMPGKPDMNDL